MAPGGDGHDAEPFLDRVSRGGGVPAGGLGRAGGARGGPLRQGRRHGDFGDRQFKSPKKRNPSTKRKRRLRKELHLGEFREMAFDVGWKFRASRAERAEKLLSPPIRCGKVRLWRRVKRISGTRISGTCDLLKLAAPLTHGNSHEFHIAPNEGNA